jgi:hypothetical protein
MGSSLGTQRDPTITRHLKDLYPSLEALFAAGEEVEALLAHPGWGHVVRLLDAEIATIDRDLDGGLKESRAEYAQAHGRRGGLRFSRDAAVALLERARDTLEQQRLLHEDGEAPSRR